MITSTIKFSQIEDRIDAEYYKPEYLELETKLIRSVNLKNFLTKLETGNWVGKHCFSNGSIPYIKVEQVKEVFLEDAEDKLNIECFKIFNNPLLDKGDILLSRVGTVGIASIFLGDTKSTFSDNVIRLKIKNLNPFYLVIFLNSKFGRPQIERLTKQAVQGVINYQSIKSIKIPIPSQSFQQNIEQIVKEAQKKQRLTDEKYKEAEQILDKELELEGLDLSTHKTFEAKFSEINERIDPEYYQPIFNEIEKVFKKQKIVNLGDISLEIKYGTSEDLFYVEKGTPFLRVTDINKFSNIEPMEGKFISNFDAERLKEYQVKTDDITISRTGTLGLAVYIDEKLDGAIYGSYFIKVKPRHKELYNRFIAFFISSKIGRLLTNRWASGGIQTNLTIDAIKSIRIPIFPQPIQQKIADLIHQSHQARKKAKELLEEAKQKVEKMIEKGGRNHADFPN